MVWLGQSSVLNLLNDGSYATLQSPPLTFHTIQMDRPAGGGIPNVKDPHLRPDTNRSPDIRQGPPYIFSHRLVKGRDRLLAAPEALPMPLPRTILLPRRVADNTGGIPFHTRCRVQICPCGRRGPGCGRRPRSYTTLHPRVQ